jgi:hypothetical protein
MPVEMARKRIRCGSYGPRKAFIYGFRIVFECPTGIVRSGIQVHFCGALWDLLGGPGWPAGRAIHRQVSSDVFVSPMVHLFFTMVPLGLCFIVSQFRVAFFRLRPASLKETMARIKLS